MSVGEQSCAEKVVRLERALEASKEREQASRDALLKFLAQPEPQPEPQPEAAAVPPPPRAPEPLVNGLPASLAACMAEEACAAVAEFQADWDDDVSGCCEPVNERERLLAYVLSRAAGDCDVYRRAIDRGREHGEKAWDSGYEHAKEEDRWWRERWERERSEHAGELEDLEERLEAEVARNHRLQEALVVATMSSK